MTRSYLSNEKITREYEQYVTNSQSVDAHREGIPNLS
jgi:hypothetical protein